MNIELTEQEIYLLRKYTGYAHMKHAYPDENFRMHIAKEDLEESSLLFEKLSNALGAPYMDAPGSINNTVKGVPQQ